MQPRRRRRWVAWGLLLAVVACGGVYAANWWNNRPAQLLAAAGHSFEEGERAFQQAEDVNDEAHSAERRAAARAAYEAAERDLQRACDETKTPLDSNHLLLRHKLLLKLAQLHSLEERERGDADPNRPSLEMVKEAWKQALLAAAEPTCAEAQALMLGRCFAADALDKAGPFATNLLLHPPADTSQGTDFHPYVLGAHFVLAQAALTGAAPRPEEALEHLRQSRALQKPGEETKWRAVALEVRAWKALAVVQKPTKVEPADGPRARCRACVREALDRLHREHEQIAAWTTKATGAPPTLLTLSPTDTRGLFEFLTLSIEGATDRDEVAQRTALALSTWEMLVAVDKPSELVLREAARRITALPALLDKLPAAVKLKPDDEAKTLEHVESLTGLIQDAGHPVDPGVFLAQARLAHRQGRFAAAQRQAQRGIQAAKAGRLPGDQRPLLDLHAEAAWIFVLQGRVHDAEEHLAVLRQFPKTFGGLARLAEGLAAVLDGRLDQGVRSLLEAQQHQDYGQTVYPYLGLAYAYVAMGDCTRALPYLEKLVARYNRYEQLPAEEKAVAAQLLPGPAALALELYRSHLGLDHLAEAEQYKELLEGQPEALTASLALIHRCLSLDRHYRQARQPDLARQALDAARKELTLARQQAPDDVRLLSAEVERLSAEPGNDVRAEPLLRTYIEQHPERKIDGELASARWLLQQGRIREAGRSLDGLAKVELPEHRRQYQFLRAQWLLADGHSCDAADQLLGLLHAERHDAGGEFYLVSASGIMSRHENDGLTHFWRGTLAQVRGDYAQAVRSYERSVQFAPFRTASQRGLLACLLQVSAKDSPVAAHELAAELLRSHPADVALLLGFIEAAAKLDNLYGAQGMEGALAALETALRAQGLDPALGPYFKARAWLSVQRPDLARRELARGLQANPAHEPSLLLAVPLVAAEEDWEATLRYATALYGFTPDRIDVRVAKAKALAGLGRFAEGEAICRSLMEQQPGRAEGYFGMSNVRELAGDDAGAASWLARWRERHPNDLHALEEEVRLRVVAAQSAEAMEMGEHALIEQIKRIEESAAAGAGSRQKRQQAERDRVARFEAQMTLAIARGLFAGESYAYAASWGTRALTLAQRLPPSEAETLPDAHVLCGDVNAALARQEKAGAARKDLAERAIEHYRVVFAKVPGHPTAGARLAALLSRERGEHEAALAIVQRLRQGRYSQTLVTGERLSLEFLDTLGIVYRDAGRHKEAIQLFQEALRRYAGEPEIYLHLGRAYAGLGKPRDAVETLSRAVRLAEERAESSAAMSVKTRWLDIAAEARREQQGLVSR